MAINFESLPEAKNTWQKAKEEVWKAEEEVKKAKQRVEEAESEFWAERTKLRKEVEILIKNYLENNRNLTVELPKEEFESFENSFRVNIEIDGVPIELSFRCTEDELNSWEYAIGCDQIDNAYYLHTTEDNTLTVQGQLDILFVCKTEERTIEERKQITMKSY